MYLTNRTLYIMDMDMQVLVSLVLFFLSMMFAMAFILDRDERTRAAQAAAQATQATTQATAEENTTMTLASLQERANDQEKQLNRMFGVMDRLVQGLFNPTSQKNTVEFLDKVMSGKMETLSEVEFSKELKKIREENSSPTTRQGDENSEEIVNLLDRIQALEDKMCTVYSPW